MAILGKASSLTCKYQVRMKVTLKLTTTGKQVQTPFCQCFKTSFSWFGSEPLILLLFFFWFMWVLDLDS